MRDEAQQAGFPTPTWSTHHYRMRQLPLKLFQGLLARVGQGLLARVGQELANQKPRVWCLLLIEGTGLGFQDRYALSWRRGESPLLASWGKPSLGVAGRALSWRRGESLRRVQSPVRLVILVLVEE